MDDSCVLALCAIWSWGRYMCHNVWS